MNTNFVQPPPTKTITSESEQLINAKLLEEFRITKESEALVNSRLKALAPLSDGIAIDPLFKAYVENIYEKTRFYETKLENFGSIDKNHYDEVRSLSNSINSLLANYPEETKLLLREVQEMKNETIRMMEEEIPKLMEEYDRLSEINRNLRIKAQQMK